MSATARLVEQMTPAEKLALDKRANREGFEAPSPTILRSLDVAIAATNALKRRLPVSDVKLVELQRSYSIRPQNGGVD